MRAVLSLLCLALLAACGADGKPVPPAAPDATAQPGLSVSGEISAGVTTGG